MDILGTLHYLTYINDRIDRLIAIDFRQFIYDINCR